MVGYHRDPKATAQALRDGWLHTGDLGFVVECELFVTGRVKDLIDIAGRNYHPYPAEAAAAAAGAHTGSAAAVGVPDPARGSEMLAIVGAAGPGGDGAEPARS
jgi:fatty-acyl-CoA synthase